MICSELTTFLQKVLDKRELIYDPQAERASEIEELIQTIERMYEKIEPFHILLRIRLSRELDFTYIEDFHDGWAVAEKEHGESVMMVNVEGDIMRGEEGNVLEFYDADQFSEGVAAVRPQKGLELRFLKTDSTFIDGNFGMEQSDLDQYRFSFGLGVACSPGSKTPKYINMHGKFGLELNKKTSYASRFTPDGYATFIHRPSTSTSQDMLLGFVDPNGEILQTEDGGEFFDEIREFSDGYAWVKIKSWDGQIWWRIIDTGGCYQRDKHNQIIGIEEGMTVSKFHNGWAKIKINNTNKTFYLNPKGEYLKDETGGKMFWRIAHDFSEGYAVVREDDWQIIDIHGQYLRDDNHEIIKLHNPGDGFVNGLLAEHIPVQDGPDPWNNHIEIIHMDCEGKFHRFGNNQSLKHN